MAARRIPLGLLAPVSLVILVVALGALQYRWVGQVSEADRAQLKQSLDRRAREFADDFDRQIGRAYDVFRLPASFSTSSPDVFAKKFDDWQATAAFAGLIKNAYYVSSHERDFTLSRFDPQTRAFAAVEWPKALQPVRSRLLLSLPHTVETSAGKSGTFMLSTSQVLPDVPAIVIPQEPEIMPGLPSRATERMAAGNISLMVRDAAAAQQHVVLELDHDFIASTMLPALVDRHFSDSGADRFKVSVMNPESKAVLTRGLQANQSLSAATADALVPFFGIRFETLRVSPLQARTTATMWTAQTKTQDRADIERRARATAGGAVVFSKPVPGEQLSMVIEQQHTAAMGAAAGVTATRAASMGWHILLQHAAGSLDAAVANARRRNLWLSFGILGVLAASTFLVMLNARRSEKLAAQQMDFVATVSHELRTPVAVIRSAAQNLAAGVVNDAEQAKRYGEMIDVEGRRLTDMVEQVLEYAGLSGNRRPAASRPVDVASLVHDVVNTSQSLPEAHEISFDVRIDDNVPPVMADRDGLRRALLNLVSNALKYADEGRWIGLTVSREPGRNDGQVLVSVTDRGRGIPPDEMAHIFEPFYRGRLALNQQIHGNGLGLSLVKRIAEAHGGRVTVKSAPGQGATFTIALPAASGAVARVPQWVDLA
jgi:signal transduction histidine kinase/type II secretory pathway pseudopilin PulG